ncbi:rhomboid family intramembrane serine protease [Chitinophaga sp.]|uniref:rhomboid family intramembrane serine protease n=1 Tax=Chitinophaga sp. TaxID=1869181 RepID=UPI0031D806CB
MSEFRPRRFDILPLVIKNLLIINGLVFFGQYTMGEIQNPSANHFLEDLFALHYWGSPLFKPHQFLTHLFMHGSIGHLFSNMFTLWMFGSTLENLWGSKRFLIFYLICGLGAALCHMGVVTYENMRLTHDINAYFSDPSLANFNTLTAHFDLSTDKIVFSYPNSPAELEMSKLYIHNYQIEYRDISTLGASGAVFGLLFAFGYLFPNSLVYLYFLFPMKAKYIVAAMIIFELVSGIRNSAGDNVAHFAHLGGVLFSYLLLRNWNKKNRRHFY